MPFLPDGTPPGHRAQPPGRALRMNIGQVLEVHLGYAAKALGWKVATPHLQRRRRAGIANTLKLAACGRTARAGCTTAAPASGSTTPSPWATSTSSSSTTWWTTRSTPAPPAPLPGHQQPLGGKPSSAASASARWRCGPWRPTARPTHLQEILTVKSDDVTGRVKTYESIVKGYNVPKPGVARVLQGAGQGAPGPVPGHPGAWTRTATRSSSRTTMTTITSPAASATTTSTATRIWAARATSPRRATP